MDDIVERLKYHTATLDRALCIEAAREIEKLRDLLQGLDKVIDFDIPLGRGFQEEVEAALPEFQNQK